jgi:hypothetical protein
MIKQKNIYDIHVLLLILSLAIVGLATSGISGIALADSSTLPKIGDELFLEPMSSAGQMLRHNTDRLEFMPFDDTDHADMVFKIVGGLAGNGSVSIEAVNNQDHYFHFSAGRMALEKNDGSKEFKETASFKMIPGLEENSRGISFESVSHPDQFLRHTGLRLDMTPSDHTPAFAKDATFLFEVVDASFLKAAAKTAHLKATTKATFHVLTMVVEGDGFIGSEIFSCGRGTCKGDVLSDRVLSVSASSPGDFEFGGWGGYCSGGNPTCRIPMDQDRTVTAKFVPTVGAVITVPRPSGGRIQDSSGRLWCASRADGTKCSITLKPGESILIYAFPESPLQKFTSWGGACAEPGAETHISGDGTMGTCTLKSVKKGTTTVSGTFTASTKPTHKLTVSTGQGGFSGSPIASFGPGASSVQIPEGDSVDFNGSAMPGYDFSGWSGDCKGGNPCHVVMDHDHSITSSFTAAAGATLTISPRPTNGLLQDTSGRLWCGSRADGTKCSLAYRPGDKILIYAFPENDRFKVGAWGGACKDIGKHGGFQDSTGTCEFTIQQDSTVSGEFPAR